MSYEHLCDLGENLIEGGDDVAVVFLHLELVLVSGGVIQLQPRAEHKMSKHIHAITHLATCTATEIRQFRAARLRW